MRPTPLAGFLDQRLRVTPRGAVEFLIVAMALALCDPSPASLAVGGAVSTVGEILRIIAAGYGYNVGELSLRGPYRFVRHPYFLGSALLFIGLCITSRDAYVMGIAAVAITWIYWLEFHRGEQRLAKFLGPRFAEYRDRVPAFVPQLVPAPAAPDDHHGFSLEFAILRGRHRELDALLGLAFGFGLLYLCYWLTAKDLFHLGVVITGTLYFVGRLVYFGVAKRRGDRGGLAQV